MPDLTIYKDEAAMLVALCYAHAQLLRVETQTEIYAKTYERLGDKLALRVTQRLHETRSVE